MTYCINVYKSIRYANSGEVMYCCKSNETFKDSNGKLINLQTHSMSEALNSKTAIEIRNSLENLNFRYQGVVTSDERPFTPQDHDAITNNMMVMGKVSNGRVDYAYIEDQQRSAIVRVKRSTH